jgi:quinol monooxygenase YgiN
MIQSRVTIYALPNHRDELIRSICQLVESLRLDSGCHDCRLYVAVSDPNAITLVEEWRTRRDMERRLRSTAYGQLLQLMEMSHAPPETVFHTISQTSGLETIREARLSINATTAKGGGL